MNIVVLVLDLMHVHNFNCQMVNGVKMLLFMELIINLPSMLIIGNDILVLGDKFQQIN